VVVVVVEALIVVDVVVGSVVVGVTGLMAPWTLPTLIASATNVPTRSAVKRFICAFCCGAQIWATTVVRADAVADLPRRGLGMKRQDLVAEGIPPPASAGVGVSKTRAVSWPCTLTPRPLTRMRRSEGLPLTFTKELAFTLTRSTTWRVVGCC